MQLRALLRKRVHFSIGFVEPTLPTLQASGDDAPVGRWFSANLGVGNLLTVAVVTTGIVSGYATLKSNVGDNTRRIDGVNERVVPRKEIEAYNAATNLRITTLESGQTQIFNHLLSGCK